MELSRHTGSVPDWGRTFLNTNEGSGSWVWLEEPAADNITGIVGISGTRYTHIECVSGTETQAKIDVLAQM